MIKLDFFDSLLEPVFVLNEAALVIYCNEPASLVCGSTVRKMTRQKRPLTEWLQFSEDIDWLAKLKEVNEPTPYKELNFKNQNGEEGRVQLTAQRCSSDGDQEGQWIIFVRDVTLEERLQKKYRAELEQKEDVILELQKAQAELQNYSRNLESMVQERTRQIQELNIQMKALLDSLSQGFLIFNEAGDCLPAYSQSCLRTLEKLPQDKKIWDVLNLKSSEQETFKKWISTLFGNFLPFDDLKPLGPDKYEHSEGRSIALDFFPLMSSSSSNSDQLQGVVLVASDITELKAAQKAAAEEKKSAQFILDLVQKQTEIGHFVHEAEKIIHQIHDVTHSTNIVSAQDELFRWIHTLKGGSGSFTINHISEHCHEAERLLSQLKTDTKPSLIKRFIQETNLIEQSFSDFKSEARKVLGSKAFSQERYVNVKVHELKSWADQFALWSKGQSTSDFIYNQYIFDEIQNYLTPYKELILKIAEKQEKKVLPLIIEGGDLRIPPDKYSSLLGTFVHIFRNIIDHGLEFPMERLECGKSEEGTVRFEAEIGSSPQLGSCLKICLSDDGRGINPKIIREKMQKNGKNTSQESDTEVIQHIFDSQFSTRQEVTELSGRGVGLEAVRFEVEALGGRIWVESKFGKGSDFYIELPWSVTKKLKSVA